MVLKWYGPEVHAAITNGAVNGLNRAAEKLRNKTRPLTPRETGALRESLQTSDATKASMEAAVYTENPYAVYQHEIFSYRRRVGGPKFLERAANDYRQQFSRDLMQAIREAGGL